MTNILIDSDVILDMFFDRKPHSQYAEAILSACASGEIQGFVTHVMMSNIYYLLRKANSHTQVIAQLRILTDIVQVLPMSHNSVLSAVHSTFKDFEDALQYEAALAHGEISIIITRNVRDYARGTLIVQTPEQFIRGR